MTDPQNENFHSHQNMLYANKCSLDVFTSGVNSTNIDGIQTEWQNQCTHDLWNVTVFQAQIRITCKPGITIWNVLQDWHHFKPSRLAYLILIRKETIFWANLQHICKNKLGSLLRKSTDQKTPIPPWMVIRALINVETAPCGRWSHDHDCGSHDWVGGVGCRVITRGDGGYHVCDNNDDYDSQMQRGLKM